MRLTQSLFAILLVGPSLALAYDTETHAWVMYQGYLKSNLAGAALKERLGFDRLDDTTAFRVSDELATLGDRQERGQVHLLNNGVRVSFPTTGSGSLWLAVMPCSLAWPV